MWPNSWHGVDFRRPPFDIVHAHTFGPFSRRPTPHGYHRHGQDSQVLPPHTIRQLFTDHAAASALKVTATHQDRRRQHLPQVDDFSLLSFPSHTLTRERIQMAMVDVRLLIINECSTHF